MERAFDTLILSDVHLGAEISRARDALNLLKSTSFRRLILLGDIFNDLNFRRLKKEHWQFLSYIRKLSNLSATWKSSGLKAITTWGFQI